MKKLINKHNLVLLAALPAAILVANNAMAGVDVYGKVNITLQQNDAKYNLGAGAGDVDSTKNYTLESNASRLGFKTSTDLGSTGLKGVAKMEYQTSVDAGSGPLSQRNIYAGVQGGFGTIIAGKFDTPLKESQGKFDLFNDYIYGDLKSVLVVGEDRASNIVMYSSPKMDNGLSVNFAFMPGETSGVTNAAGNANNKNNGMADYLSASIAYDSESFYAALAANKDYAATANSSGANIVRLTGIYKVDAFTFGAMIQQADTAKNSNWTGGTAVQQTYAEDIFRFNSGAAGSPFGNALLPAAGAQAMTIGIKDQNGYLLNTSYTMGDNVFKLQGGKSTATANSINAVGLTAAQTAVDSSVDVTMIDIGYDYHLGKDALVTVYYSTYKLEYTSPTALKEKQDVNTVAVGYELKF